MNYRYLVVSGVVLTTFLPIAASAHVAVKPDEVGVGAFQTFTIGVPDEKDQPTVSLRLVMPGGLKEVTPNVKPGWTINEKKSGTAEDAPVTEISWTGGQIPVGQRDEFLFNAQVPSKATSLNWKAYQTYADGSVVSWDQVPSGKDDESETPFSTTRIVNDLTSAKSTESDSAWEASAALVLSILALILSVGVLFLSRFHKNFGRNRG